MKFIALKTKDGTQTGRISFYWKVFEVTRQGFYEYPESAKLKITESSKASM